MRRKGKDPYIPGQFLGSPLLENPGEEKKMFRSTKEHREFEKIQVVQLRSEYQGSMNEKWTKTDLRVFIF